MGMKISMPLGTKVMVKYNDIENQGMIMGNLTNVFNGLDYTSKAVAGIFVEKWVENGKELEIKRNVNDKTNIFRPDIIQEVDETIKQAIK